MFSQTIINDEDLIYNNENNEIFTIYYEDIEIMTIQTSFNGILSTSFIWYDDLYLYEIYGDFTIYEAIQILKGIE